MVSQIWCRDGLATDRAADLVSLIQFLDDLRRHFHGLLASSTGDDVVIRNLAAIDTKQLATVRVRALPRVTNDSLAVRANEVLVHHVHGRVD